MNKIDIDSYPVDREITEFIKKQRSISIDRFSQYKTGTVLVFHIFSGN